MANKSTLTRISTMLGVIGICSGFLGTALGAAYSTGTYKQRMITLEKTDEIIAVWAKEKDATDTSLAIKMAEISSNVKYITDRVMEMKADSVRKEEIRN